jgi:hypothetical protein
MSTTTRESMRRELKELAKLAETMRKPSADASLAEEAPEPIEFPQSALERPVTPASASRVSVPPMATPLTPPLFDYAEAKPRSGKRTGVVALLVGAGLAIALVAGAAVGKSLAGNATASTPPVDVRGAAALVTPPVTPAAEQPAAAVAPAAVTAVAPPAQPAAATPPVVATPATPAKAAAAAPVHKHFTPRPAAAATPKASVASNAAPASGGSDAAPAPKPVAAASPGLAKPAPAKASAGGGDSLEDLIRKEVAAGK